MLFPRANDDAFLRKLWLLLIVAPRYDHIHALIISLSGSTAVALKLTTSHLLMNVWFSAGALIVTIGALFGSSVTFTVIVSIDESL